MKKRIAVLLSGNGSNLEALYRQGTAFDIALVASNKNDVGGVNKAKSWGLNTIALGREDYPSVLAQKEAIYNAVDKSEPDLIVLAGYLQIIEPNFVQRYKDRIINIHPSLLPNFAGLHGRAVHEAAIASEHAEHGCTVHLVDNGVDTGSKISQMSLIIKPKETADEIAARVLALEHTLYPWTVDNISLGKIELKNGKVSYSSEIVERCKQKGIKIFQ